MNALEAMASFQVPIVLSHHARERCRERYPDMKPARMVDEVRAAINEARCSTERPPWLPQNPHGRSIYCWTADGARTYTLRAVADAWLVVTVIAPKYPERLP